MVHELRNSPGVKQFIRSNEYKAGKLHVDATLCDHHFGFHNFTREEFGFEANTCVNHALDIGAHRGAYSCTLFPKCAFQSVHESAKYAAGALFAHFFS